MEYKIAIPSFKREKTLVKKTLKYLIDDCKELQSNIYIFVADEDEAKRYGKEILDARYGLCRLVVGVHTLMGQRNFIQYYFPENTYVINFDDDVDGLFYANEKKLHLLTNLRPVIEHGYKSMLYHSTAIFGVYPVANHFFMDERTTTELKYIVGCFWGCIIKHDKALEVELEDKEDFERSIKYFIKFKKVIRINSICVKTNYYKEPGGMQVTRTPKRVDDSAKYLIEKYPAYCVLNTAKKNKEFTEIKLVYKPADTAPTLF